MSAQTMPAPAQSPHEVALVDLLDRLLGKGVVAAGDVTLSVAGVDLVYVDLRALIASAGTLARGEVVPATAPRPAPATRTTPTATRNTVIEERARSPLPASRAKPRPAPRAPLAPFPRRIATDPERVEKGLAQLVLTLVELLRELMERQALRRIDDGTLPEEAIDRLGETFMLLDRRMDELKHVFGVEDDDLNINLGPLGNLL